MDETMKSYLKNQIMIYFKDLKNKLLDSMSNPFLLENEKEVFFNIFNIYFSDLLIHINNKELSRMFLKTFTKFQHFIPDTDTFITKLLNFLENLQYMDDELLIFAYEEKLHIDLFNSMTVKKYLEEKGCTRMPTITDKQKKVFKFYSKILINLIFSENITEISNYNLSKFFTENITKNSHNNLFKFFELFSYSENIYSSIIIKQFFNLLSMKKDYSHSKINTCKLVFILIQLLNIKSNPAEELENKIKESESENKISKELNPSEFLLLILKNKFSNLEKINYFNFILILFSRLHSKEINNLTWKNSESKFSIYKLKKNWYKTISECNTLKYYISEDHISLNFLNKYIFIDFISEEQFIIEILQNKFLNSINFYLRKHKNNLELDTNVIYSIYSINFQNLKKLSYDLRDNNCNSLTPSINQENTINIDHLYSEIYKSRMNLLKKQDCSELCRFDQYIEDVLSILQQYREHNILKLLEGRDADMNENDLCIPALNIIMQYDRSYPENINSRNAKLKMIDLIFRFLTKTNCNFQNEHYFYIFSLENSDCINLNDEQRLMHFQNIYNWSLNRHRDEYCNFLVNLVSSKRNSELAVIICNYYRIILEDYLNIMKDPELKNSLIESKNYNDRSYTNVISQALKILESFIWAISEETYVIPYFCRKCEKRLKLRSCINLSKYLVLCNHCYQEHLLVHIPKDTVVIKDQNIICNVMFIIFDLIQHDLFSKNYKNDQIHIYLRNTILFFYFLERNLNRLILINVNIKDMICNEAIHWMETLSIINGTFYKKFSIDINHGCKIKKYKERLDKITKNILNS